MKNIELLVHFRYNDEKDFYYTTVEAESFEEAEKELRKNDRRIFKIEEIKV